MEFNFDFTYLKNGAPIVTLSSLGIAFNKGAVDLLGAPEQINVGFDEEKCAIGVRKHDPNSNAPVYDFASRVKNDWVRIGAKDFMRYLSKVSKIDFLTKAKQFLPEFDDNTKTLIIQVDESHAK